MKVTTRAPARERNLTSANPSREVVKDVLWRRRESHPCTERKGGPAAINAHGMAGAHASQGCEKHPACPPVIELTLAPVAAECEKMHVASLLKAFQSPGHELRLWGAK
jgi:hypothetical protein